jgi:hypothetical protein
MTLMMMRGDRVHLIIMMMRGDGLHLILMLMMMMMR